MAQAAAQAGQLANDQAVPGLQGAQQFLDAPLGRSLARRGLGLDEAVDGEPLLPGVVQDGELLVGQVLGAGRNTQVGGTPRNGKNCTLSRVAATELEYYTGFATSPDERV